MDADDVEDLEEAPDEEVQKVEDEVLDRATSARTISELKAEIEILKGLEDLAQTVRRSGTDTKWRELAGSSVNIRFQAFGFDQNLMQRNLRSRSSSYLPNIETPLAIWNKRYLLGWAASRRLS